jgi:uncharacterized membrane protein
MLLGGVRTPDRLSPNKVLNFSGGLPTRDSMRTNLKRGIRAIAVIALLALPVGALADVTPAPVVAPTPPPVASTPVQTPTQPTTPTRSTTPTQSTTPSAAQIAAQKKAAAAAAAKKAAAERKARIAAAQAKAAAARKARIAAARQKAALLAARQKAAAEHTRLVAQQQHAEDTAEATYAKALQRDDAFRFAASAADSIGASAAVHAAPTGPADATGSTVFATSPTKTPPVPLFAAVLAAVVLAAAAAYVVRARAWRVMG